MPKVAVYDMEGRQVGEIDLNEEVFGVELTRLPSPGNSDV